MCGIAGIVKYNQAESKININLLKRMSDQIVHRGPDDEGQWLNEDRSCGLAFRRLSIIDLSKAGAQPMHTEDGRFSIVLNGEVYNHLDIRKRLIDKGYKYKSQTDTESIIYGYSEWGKDILEKMHGMFAFAIWDNEKKELFAARDRLGKKPFYYTIQNGYFIFASEIKSILQFPALSVEANIEEIPNYLSLGMSCHKSSLFKNIKKLQAGHCLKLKQNGELEIKRYWNPYCKLSDYKDLDFNEAKELLFQMFRSSVESRMMSDLPLAVFLSGGLDSSLNAAIMSEISSKPIKSYTVGFKDLEKYNELEYARKVSQLFKTEHKEVLITESDCFGILEQLPWFEDEPNGDPVCLPLYFLSKLTRDDGTAVVQVGEGSDEQFCGYESSLRDFNIYSKYLSKYQTLPPFLRKFAYKTSSICLKNSRKLDALEYIRRASLKEPFYAAGNPIFSSEHLKKLFNKNFEHLAENPIKYAKSLEELSRQMNPEADFLQTNLIMDISFRLPELLLMRADKIGMAHSIETRVPFLDHRIVELSLALPERVKVPNLNETKTLLKKAIEPVLPKEIIYRKKQGFWAPVNEWFRNEWFAYTKDKLLSSDLLKSGLFKKDSIEELLILHKNSPKNDGKRIYSLLMLALWWERFL
ncbi:MAG: asparagine synthase (glutamine-hydrolyzing) [Ignavibacteria bacterium]|nr:asparagine synthase (glutamine-hydrolyzing) [Ignavibacteria bacterium]